MNRRSLLSLTIWLAAAVLALLLAGCGSLNRKENVEIYTAGALSGYTMIEDKPYYGPVEAPWLMICTEPSHDGDVVTGILAVSDDLEKEPFSDALLAKVRTLIVCRVSEFSKQYKSTTTGVIVTGTGEKGTIRYYLVDHAAQTLTRLPGADEESVKMPEKSTSTPHRSISRKLLVSMARKRAESGVCPCHDPDYFRISKQGELTATNYFGNQKSEQIVVIPPSVKTIDSACSFFGGAKNQGGKTATALIPATVEEIEHGAFCYNKSLYWSERFRLVVEPGSAAERYAIDEGLEYMSYEEFYGSFRKEFG